jgi:His/Glu/Gln/Arg/opine family amino acid ABC transporter permease subunit
VEIVWPWLPRFLEAAWLTLQIFVVVSALGTVAGLAVALLERGAAGRVLRPLAATYSWVFRATPELVVLLFCFLGLPSLGIEIGPLAAAILGFTLIGAAYEYEVFRGALRAVPAGQYEAARALGIPWPSMMRRIVLPQVLRIAVTPWVTYATGSVKRISIASAVAVSEIMYVTKQAISFTNASFEFILLATLLYGTMASAMMLLERVLARRFDHLRDRRPDFLPA